VLSSIGVMPIIRLSLIRRTILELQLKAIEQNPFREDIGEYVAQLQLHMTLQARNLVPPLTEVTDSRKQMLQETQAIIEKLVSRQTL
jgi:hypothetical protein